MTKEQITLLKSSWKTLQYVDAGFIGDLFYSKLFFDNPRLKKMFPTSMTQQYSKLIDMLSFIIARVDKPEMLTADIKALAVRHKGYNVKTEHYTMIGAALIWTLERGLKNDWTSKVKQAWLALYTMIAEIMISVTEQLPN